MSLMGTLAKIAVGVAVAKGVGGMMKGGGSRSAGTGGSFGGANSPGGLEGMMGDLLGGGSTRQSGGSGGGLGGFLEELGANAPGGATSASTSGRSGGLDDLIGGLTGSGSGGGGGIGGLLGGLLGGVAGGAAGSRGGSFGDLLNQSLGNRGEPDVQPTREQEAAAGLMLSAMIQAAKSDGKIDAAEQKKLLSNLGEVSAEEKRFVQSEMAKPIDVQGLARQVPRGLEGQVYTMSLMAIDLDNRNEAQYLHQLAGAMGLDQRQVNHIHSRLGVQALYS